MEEKRYENIANVFVSVIKKPQRKAIIKRVVAAHEYMSYRCEVGCDVWSILVSMKSFFGESVCMCLPERLRPAGALEYVMGVEDPCDYSDAAPE